MRIAPTLKRRIALLIPLAVFGLGLPAANAATPKNTIVMAKDISDLITLDPAEVFELSGGEVIANIYDRLMMYEPDDLSKLVGGVAESWEVSDDGKTYTFKLLEGISQLN